MDQTTLLYVMTAFVAIAAIALLIQAGMLVGLYKKTKELSEKLMVLTPKAESLIAKVELAIPKVESLVPKTEALLTSAKATVDQSRQQILEITTRSTQILDSTKNQLAMVEEVVTDATSRAKVQLERIELVLDDTVTRAHETVATFHGGVMRPLKELNGIAAGLRAAAGFLMRHNRTNVAQATSDEEMFI